MKKTLLILSMLLTIPAFSGCLERKMYIKSEPPNARVTIDGEEKGVTPVEIPFTYYGTRKITLQKKHK